MILFPLSAGTLTTQVQMTAPLTLVSANAAPGIPDLIGLRIGVLMQSGVTNVVTLAGVDDPTMPTVVGAWIPGLFNISSGGVGQFRFTASPGNNILTATIYAYAAGLAFDVCCAQNNDYSEGTPGSAWGWPLDYGGVDGYPDGTATYWSPMSLSGHPFYGDLFGAVRLDWSGSGGIGDVDVVGDLDKVHLTPEPSSWQLVTVGALLAGLRRLRRR